MKRANIIISVMLLVFAGFYAVLTASLPQRGLPNTMEADFLPWVLTALLAFLSFMLLIKTLVAKEKETGEPDPGITTKVVFRILLLLAIFVAYVFTMIKLGYLMITPFFIMLIMYFAGSRKWREILLVSVLTTSVVYFLFHYFFRVPLPKLTIF